MRYKITTILNTKKLIKGILSTYGDFIEVNKFHTEYKPKYENFQFIVVTDSVSLLSEEEGRNKKQEIDLYCKKLIWLFKDLFKQFDCKIHPTSFC